MTEACPNPITAIIACEVTREGEMLTKDAGATKDNPTAKAAFPTMETMVGYFNLSTICKKLKIITINDVRNY